MSLFVLLHRVGLWAIPDVLEERFIFHLMSKTVFLSKLLWPPTCPFYNVKVIGSALSIQALSVICTACSAGIKLMTV